MNEWINDQIFAIGCLTIFAGIVYLLIRINSNREAIEKENRILKEYSEKCKIGMTEDQVKEILKDPNERARAKKKYMNEVNKKEQENITKRKIGNMYERDIFEIFEMFEQEENSAISITSRMGYESLVQSSYYPSKNDLIEAIKEHFSIDLNKAKSLLDLWKKNDLVYIWSDKCSVGEILSFTSMCYDPYKSSKGNFTYEQWRAIKKYNKDIYAIFKNKEIPENEIIHLIEIYYSISQEDAIKFFYNVLLQYDIIEKTTGENYNSPKKYEIGSILNIYNSITH